MAEEAIQIGCGNLQGFLFPARFGPAGKSLCIKLDNKESSPWMTPIEFEKRAGKGSQHNWKRTVRSVTHDNKMLAFLIDEAILRPCSDKHCKCEACQASLVPESPTSITLLSEKRDTDSDSGISVEISSNSADLLHATPSISSNDELLTTKEQDKPLPNYTLWVQEAIIALTSGEKSNQGCSLLGIILYILNNYSTEENIFVMNTKIRSALALLKRMGIVTRSGEDENDDDDELEYVTTLIKSDEADEDAEEEKSKEPVHAMKINKSKAPAKVGRKPKNLENAAKKNKAGVSSALAAKKAKKSIDTSITAQTKPTKTKKATVVGKENSVGKTFTFHNKTMKKLSPALASVCGKKKMGRHEAVREIWIYIKKHKLQDPNQKMVIVCDEKLKAVTKKKRVTCSEILSCLGAHMTAI